MTEDTQTPLIMVIDALDHFSSESKENKKCVVRFVGEKIDEDENYFYIRHIKSALYEKDSVEEFHAVIKASILRMGVIELTLEKYEK